MLFNIKIKEMSNDLCTKVPDNLKRLLRYVLKSFYSFELYLVMEMLIIYPCIKEEDLAELLKLDQKIVRQYLINLKQEKFISEKSTIETSADAKQQKKTYYYVNYKSMVNVIKYKLDKIRLQIELEEKQCTSRASFKCTQCLKTYSDLDMNEMLLLTMRCTHCGGLVDEDSSNIQNRAARNLLAKFNTQMELIYRLLHEVENIKLAPNILSPAPTDYSELIQSLNTSPNAPTGGSSDTQKKSNNNATKGHTIWSGEASRFVQIQTKTEINFIEASVATIDVNSTMGETNNAFDENSQDFRYEEIKANNALSSIIDSKVRSKTQTSSILKSDQFLTKQETIDDNPEKKNLDENILKLLLIHENKNKNDLINRQASLSSGGGSVVGGSTLKKRDSNHLNNDIEQLMSHGFGIVDNNHVNPKKRRLNGKNKSFFLFKLGSLINLMIDIKLNILKALVIV